jgi:hypothetical protein
VQNGTGAQAVGWPAAAFVLRTRNRQNQTTMKTVDNKPDRLR